MALVLSKKEIKKVSKYLVEKYNTYIAVKAITMDDTYRGSEYYEFFQTLETLKQINIYDEVCECIRIMKDKGEVSILEKSEGLI